MTDVKLNIGAGDTMISGFTPIDRKFGNEAFPLEYPDNSVSEIRASHVLEHFSFRDAKTALEDWVRVLEPGGRMRISVPDVDKCLKDSDPNRVFFLMGGQTDENDFHRSAYDQNKLCSYMQHAGLTDLKEWESDGLDTSGHRVSLNIEGRKPKNTWAVAGETPTPSTAVDLKIGAYMTLPRYESVAARSIIEAACKKLGIGLATSQGVFWGQCMQRNFNEAIEQGVDWILCLDSDSVFSEQHLSELLDVFGTCPEADALAALQCRRGSGYPLATVGGTREIEIDGQKPFLVTTAHFGMTLIRTDVLKTIPKPWFVGKPDEDGEWGSDRLDDDIWFWHQWRLAGKTIYMAPSVSIGHVEETVAVFDEHLQPKHEYISEWREKHLNIRQSSS